MTCHLIHSAKMRQQWGDRSMCPKDISSLCPVAAWLALFETSLERKAATHAGSVSRDQRRTSTTSYSTAQYGAKNEQRVRYSRRLMFNHVQATSWIKEGHPGTITIPGHHQGWGEAEHPGLGTVEIKEETGRGVWTRRKTNVGPERERERQKKREYWGWGGRGEKRRIMIYLTTRWENQPEEKDRGRL